MIESPLVTALHDANKIARMETDYLMQNEDLHTNIFMSHFAIDAFKKAVVFVIQFTPDGQEVSKVSNYMEFIAMDKEEIHRFIQKQFSKLLPELKELAA